MTKNLAELGRWIDAAPKGEYLCRIGGLRADPRARWRDVRVAFDLLRSRGVRRIELTDGIPTRAARLQSPLQSPSGQTVDASWSGIFVVNYLKSGDV
jgi:hypothetical protein